MQAKPYRLSLAELAVLTRRTEKQARQLLEPHECESASTRLGWVEPAAVRRLLAERGHGFGFTVSAHINLRGGIGKTTSAASLASRAAQYGYRVALLDLDPQGSASLLFDKLPQEQEPIFYDVWARPEQDLPPALKPIQDGFALLPSSLENALLDSSLSKPANLKQAVASSVKVLRQLGYDLVVIDCPPSLGAATISSICAADRVVIPVWSDPFSFKGLELTLEEIQSITETFSLAAPRVVLLYSRFDKREKIGVEALELLRAQHPDKLAPMPIRTSSEFSKALQRHQTIFAEAARNTARDDYDAFTRHLLGF